MVFNVMIQLCKITRSSKLFQRNFYLPLLKPLSPKDALRKKIITGKDVLAKKMEHYIPVLEEVKERVQRRKYTIKGQGKKRQRRKPSMKYMMLYLDDDMDNHHRLKGLLGRKGKGKGQCYTYYILEKNYTIVFPFPMERAIRDKDIVDVTVAQNQEKVIVKLKDGMKIVVPLVTYDGHAPFYRGEGWTKKEIEEFHHFGKDTMNIAKLFEAKEAGVENWELEMMRMATKRKKKQKGEGSQDWKKMMEQTAEAVNWDEFEAEAKQIVEESQDAVEDEPIAMEVDDFEATKEVNEKLTMAGSASLDLLPLMPEIPEITRLMKDGALTDVCGVSGVKVKLAKSGITRFIVGQIIKSEDGEIFMPGQTIENEDGVYEYTPGFTVLLEEEPTLLPGLVMGNDPEKPMFLPGESTITEGGELQFTETDEDFPHGDTPPPEPEVEEVELEEEQDSDEEKEEQRPPPKPRKKIYCYERPKRVELGPARVVTNIEPILFDMTLPTFEKDVIEQEKARTSDFIEKTAKTEFTIDKRRRELKLRAKKIVDSAPPVPVYEEQEPIKKSEKLKELEANIKTGNFFEVDYKKYLTKERSSRFKMEKAEYRNTLERVGISGQRNWKSVH